MADSPKPNAGNTSDEASRNSRFVSSIKEAISTVLWAAAIMLVIRGLLFEPFNIPSGSMLPTLKIGDYLFVSKSSYGYSKYSIPFSPFDFSGRVFSDTPERGDVAVFRKPTDTDIDYIKRVVGLPGDTIQVIDGILHINGEPVQRRLAGDYFPERGEKLGNRQDLYIETLPNGVEHPILEEMGDHARLDNTPEYKVPPGHYFCMGDNRDNSQDSRVLSQVGFVPLENFIGRAEIIFFSWGPSGPRFSRIFSSVD